MSRLFLRIGIATVIAQLVVVWVVYVTGGAISYALPTSLFVLIIWLAICYQWLRPLGELERHLSRVSNHQAFSSRRNHIFQWLQERLEYLEMELERRTMELATNREQFDAVLSGMNEGVIAIDETGKVLYLNRAARRILSIPTGASTGKFLAGLVRYEAVQKATDEALATRKIVNTSFTTHDAEPKQVRLRVAPMAGNPFPGITLVFHDVTELARLETIRRDFVANVSHELKTPLASIKAYAETLQLGAINKSPENLRFVRQIEQQADVLDQQIQDLLHLARVESGRESFQYESVDLVAVCRESYEHFRDEAAVKNVTISFECNIDVGGQGLVWADQDALRTIVDNLVSNAIRYSRPEHQASRKGEVKVSIHEQDKQVIVEVTDQGVGIAPEHQQRIFERFFRVDPARSREQGGTGLGLAIVKHLSNAFGGEIELKSKLGVGSTFRLTLPSYQVAVQATPAL
ncbi:MAG TPA: ATP-binding protein [Pirellulaceae bacterium]|nr:ATP-binding protein [Pirellulaceae bacterium]HMO92034.1 ATP-binding protein [Pirellulaceae bacterium]HMP68833.1 ATP-binding protein [Pirellulaceae bacterium]